MYVVDRPHGRGAHISRVRALRLLEQTGLITYHKTVIENRHRHYIVSYADKQVMLRETDIEAYIIGITSIVHKLTENHIEGLDIPIRLKEVIHTLTP